MRTGTRVLDLLDAGAPVVLVVDDVHRADLSSVQALVFALRRLVADPRPGDGALLLGAGAGCPEDLAQIEDVLARHLERFGSRRELTVTWEQGVTGE